MLFNYKNFIAELRANPEKGKIVQKYEDLIGPLGKRPITNVICPFDYSEIENTGEEWFDTLVRPFAKFDRYSIPEGIEEDDFDFGLLAQLAAASLSSKAWIEKSFDHDGQLIFRLKITVQSGDQTVTKYIDELWGFQILRLYEIWIEENINLFILWKEDQREKKGIKEAKNKKFKLWNKHLRFPQLLNYSVN